MQLFHADVHGLGCSKVDGQEGYDKSFMEKMNFEGGNIPQVVSSRHKGQQRKGGSRGLWMTECGVLENYDGI